MTRGDYNPWRVGPSERTGMWAVWDERTGLTRAIVLVRADAEEIAARFLRQETNAAVDEVDL